MIMGKTGKGGAQDGKLYFAKKFDHFKEGYVRSIQDPPVPTDAPPDAKQRKAIKTRLDALDLALKAEAGMDLVKAPETMNLAQYFVDRFRDTLAPKIPKIKQLETTVTTLEQAVKDAAEKTRLAEERAAAVERELAELRAMMAKSKKSA